MDETIIAINEKIIEAANERIIRLKTGFYFIIIILIIIIITFSIKFKITVSGNEEKKWQNCYDVKCSETNIGKVSKEEIRKARLTFRIFSETNNNEKASLI